MAQRDLLKLPFLAQRDLLKLPFMAQRDLLKLPFCSQLIYFLKKDVLRNKHTYM